MRTTILVFAGLIAVILCGCASPRPVLYPNKYYKQVGKAQAERDIDAALSAASEADLSPSGGSGKKAAQAGVDTAAGAATGAAVGAVRGDIVTGSIAGAAGGGIHGFFNWLFGPDDSVNPTYRNYVERNLREMGYEPIGWK